MEWMASVIRRMGRLLDRRRLDEELEDELAAHLALKKQHLEREGCSWAEAERQARMALGNATAWRETTREQWSFTWVESLWRDVVFGMRVLRRDRAFTAVALVTLALGIGANAAVFSLLNGLLWRALPVRAPEELVRVRLTNLPPTERAWSGGRAVAVKERRQISFPLFEALGAHSFFAGTFGIAGHGPAGAEVSGQTVQLQMSSVTGGYFSVLGVEPAIGRLLRAEDDVPGGPVGGWGVVISDAIWHRVFQGRVDAVGSRMVLEKVPFTVLGVTPASFHGVNPGMETDVWVPLSATETMYPTWQWRRTRNQGVVQTMARLKPGVSVEQARQQLGAMSRALLEEVKPENLGGPGEKHYLAMKLDVVPARSGFSYLVETFGPVLWTLMGAVAVVLLIAATNLTNLLLARCSARRQEIAVRLALGAKAGRIRRQLLVESALLAVAGTVLGVLFAQWLTGALIRGVSGEANPIQLDTSVDWNVLGFLALVLGTVVVIAGWAPAWSALRGAIHEGTKQRMNSRPVTYLRGGLVVVQVAFSLTLLGGAGLLLASLRSLLGEGTGFDAARIVYVRPDLFNAGVSEERMPAAYGRLLEEVRRQRGVRAAAWTVRVPLTGGLQAYSIEVPGMAPLPPNERLVFGHEVTDGYFAASGLRLMAGRDFPPAGVRGEKYAIVSENLARRYFGSVEAAVGRRLRRGDLDWAQVIGVVSDAKYQHIREPNPMTMYTSYWDQRKSLGMTLVVNHEGSREALLGALRVLFEREAGRAPLTQVRTVDGNIGASIASERMLTLLLGAFAAFAVLISATGIAGLLSYAVQLRRREIGIRMALGATPRTIAGQFRTYGLRLAGTGVVLGGVFSYGLRRAVDSFLFGVAPGDWMVWAAVCTVMLVCAGAASSVPARLAARLDPTTVLRSE